MTERRSRPWTSGSRSRASTSDDDEDDDDTSTDDLEVELDLDELVEDAPGALEIETITPTTEAERRRDLVIPDDPTVLSYLLSGIVQIELPRRQALLEASTTVERLEALVKLLDREVMLLASRLQAVRSRPASPARAAPKLSIWWR